MLGAIIRNELTVLRRDGRLLATMLLLIVSIATALFAGARDYHKGEAERALFSERAYQQWVEQAPKHPHRAASYGMFVSKPETGLAMLESGLRPYAGRTLRLEAHGQAVFALAPANDMPRSASGLGERSGAGLMLVGAGLLALVLGALAITRDRETGVLRQLLAQGVSPRRLLFGKYLALMGVLGTALLLLFGGLTPVVVLQSGADWPDALLRTAFSAGNVLVYVAAMLAIGLVVSALVSNSRAAFAIVLSFWLLSTLIAPRVAAHAALTLAPTPDAAAYESAIGAEFGSGYGDRPGWSEQLEVLEERTKTQYNVKSLDDLPIGFSGVRMLAMDAWSNEVSRRQYARLTDIYERQENIRMSVAALAPFIAARAVSQGTAGMDWPHYRHFSDAAETYRAAFNLQMNNLIVTGTSGQAWEMSATRADFAKTPRFIYKLPTVGWALAHSWLPITILFGWLAGAILLITLVGRRLTP